MTGWAGYPTGDYVLCHDNLTISGYHGYTSEDWRLPVYDQYIAPYQNALYTGFGECHEDNPLKNTRFDPNRYKASGLNGSAPYTYNGRTYEGLGMVALAPSIPASLENQGTNSQMFQNGGNSAVAQNAFSRLTATLNGSTSWSMPATEGITAVAPYRVFKEWMVKRYGDQPYGDLYDDYNNLIGSYSGFDSDGNACEQITLPGYVDGIGWVHGSWVEPGQDAASKWDDRVDQVVMFNTRSVVAVVNNPGYVSLNDWWGGGQPPTIASPNNEVTVIVILKKSTGGYSAQSNWSQINDLSDINVDIDGNAVERST